MQNALAVRRGIICAVCISLCAVFTMLLGQTLGAGSGMVHAPVLVCGVICGAGFGGLCGVAGPLLSALICGLPSAALLPELLCDGLVCGLASGALMRLLSERGETGVYISLVGAALMGRLAGALAEGLLYAPGLPALGVWVVGRAAAAIPGLVIQLVLLPGIIFALINARLIPAPFKASAGDMACPDNKSHSGGEENA